MVDTLKNSKEFLEVISKGHKFKNSGFIFYFLKNNVEGAKIGISIKKKTGNAVYRNKLKRQIKNLIGSNIHKLKGLNVVIVNYEKRTQPVEFNKLKIIFEKFFNEVKSL